MILRASGPVPSPFRPRALLLASPPSGEVEVDASAEFAPLESGTWVPATGASFTLCFLGQPASWAAPAMSTAIDRMRFIYFLRPDRKGIQWVVRVPTMSLFVY